MPLRLATQSTNQIAPKSDEQAAPAFACTTIELPGGARIRVEVPTDPKLQSQVGEQATELSLKERLIEEQAYSVLELKAESDKHDEKVIELNLKLEKRLK